MDANVSRCNTEFTWVSNKQLEKLKVVDCGEEADKQQVVGKKITFCLFNCHWCNKGFLNKMYATFLGINWGKLPRGYKSFNVSFWFSLLPMHIGLQNKNRILNDTELVRLVNKQQILSLNRA